MHSRATTVLIDLLWFNVMHYSSFFQYSNILVYLLTFFENIIIIMIMIEIQ